MAFKDASFLTEINHKDYAKSDKFMNFHLSYKSLMVKPLYVQMLRRMLEESDKGDSEAIKTFCTIFKQ